MKMMNEQILKDYQSDILDLFKLHYKKLSAKDINLQFKTVLMSTLKELGLNDFKQTDVLFLEEWYQLIHEHKFIKDLLINRELNEIIFHSNESIQIIYHEKKELIPLANLSIEDYQLSFENFALKNNISWNFTNPFASFFAEIENLPFRITLIHYSTSANRKSKIFLRSLKTNIPNLSLFEDNSEQIDFLKMLIDTKKNILISGSTGSGKTTFMRSLINEISPDEHLIFLEDTHELVTQSPQQTSLLAQGDVSNKSLKDYCAYALRMSPDRLMIGEMRSNEVVPFLLAMNTGHRGLMSTIHANSSGDALTRFAMLFSLYAENKELDFKLITKLVCKNIDYVIHIEKKKIKEISQVIGSEGETPFFEMIYQNNLTQ